MVDTRGEMIHGIDVSEWQGDLPWPALRAAGIAYAFIRLGDGTIIDEKAGAHRAGAVAAGIKVAPYWFCRDREDPIAQTERFLVRAMDLGQWDGPLVPDYEQASMQGASSRAWLERVITRIEAHHPHHKIFVYAGWYMLRDQIGPSEVFTRNLLWIPGGARYDKVLGLDGAPTSLMDAPTGFTTACQQWTQYGRAGGYASNLDLNVMTEAAFEEFFNQVPLKDGPTAVPQAGYEAQVAGAPVATDQAVRDRILALCRGENGVFESPPASNNVKYWDWYGDSDGVVEDFEIWGAWCAAFVSYIYDKAGVPLPPIQRDRGGFMLVSAATLFACTSGQALLENPLPGDIVIFSWYPVAWTSNVPYVWYTNPKSGQSGWEVAGDHVGIFSHMEGDTFMCWEGNTSSTGGSQDNGGEVALRPRARASIACFWRPPTLGSSASISKDDDMALTLTQAVVRPNKFADNGIEYTCWDVAWLPENGRIITAPSGGRVVEYSAVSVALEEPDDAAHGPVYVFVYDEAGLAGRMDLTNRTELYYPRVPGRQTFASNKRLIVTARECLMPA